MGTLVETACEADSGVVLIEIVASVLPIAPPTGYSLGSSPSVLLAWVVEDRKYDKRGRKGKRGKVPLLCPFSVHFVMISCLGVHRKAVV